jgi:hypothetical protein
MCFLYRRAQHRHKSGYIQARKQLQVKNFEKIPKKLKNS